MYAPLTKPNTRIEVADILRAIAIIGIILIHFLEHMDFYLFNEPEGFWGTVGQGLWDGIFFLGGGKMYAIFALLFGLSFFIQHDNQAQKGIDFRSRFAWRMLLLLLFGLFDKIFYIGDILFVYAICGFIVIPLIRLDNKVLLTLFIILALQPVELISMIVGTIDPEAARINLGSGATYGALMSAQSEGSLWDVAKISLTQGLFQGISWGMECGRFTQNIALFLAGILLGRKRLFYNEGNNLHFWKNTFFISLAASAVTILALSFLPEERSLFNTGLQNAVTMWRNLAMTAFYVSGVVLLFYKTRCGKGLLKLAPYGRMTLTHYISQSIIGTLLFYNWGFGLYRYCGHAVSVLIAIVLILIQWTFSHYWAKNHKRGPLEQVWNTLTWLPKSGSQGIKKSL